MLKMLDRINLFKVALVLGLLQIACYWFSGSMACSDGQVAIPQPDTTLYYQAARRIVEGHPFSYSEGTAACTGTTTVLYPLVLAIPYAIGFTGEAILVAGFVLNALFYLVFLLAWCGAVRNWIVRKDAQLLAIALIALSGHCAYVTFAQSDTGFWLAFGGLFAAALASCKHLYIVPLLAFLPWVRPEGMICVIAYAIMAGFHSWIFPVDRREARMRLSGAIVGILSTVGVFALNHALTGQYQFSSVAGKGHFANLFFAQAAYATVTDLISIAKELFLGLAKSVPRDFVTIPVLGAALLLTGLFAQEWRQKKSFGLSVYMLAVFGSILNVAQSGWQGTNMDRYLAWTIPLATLFVALGVMTAADRLPTNRRFLAPVFAVVFSLVGCSACPFIFHVASKDVDSSRHFARACESAMPEGASFGGNGGCDLAYFFSPRRCAHLQGIYSPEFSPKNYLSNIELLRNDPNLRFDYWIITQDMIDGFGNDCILRFGEVVVSGPSMTTLVKADWSLFDSPAALARNGKRLVEKIDLGLDRDEERSNYEIFMRWGFEKFEPYVQSGLLDGKFIVDVGRVILGGDEMSVPLVPGKDVTVVMRTWPKHGFNRNNGMGKSHMECAFSNPLKMNLSVDGSIVDTVSVSYATNSFSEASFEIPGAAIRQSPCRVGFLGDHISFGYAFYQ